jgi:hypothetical protein
VTLLLAVDHVALYPRGEADAHGWAEPGTAPRWCGAGNLQLGPGTSDPRAGDGGGRGPHAPAAVPGGTLFLPPDAEPAEGDTALIRSRPWTLSEVRFIADPMGGGLACWAATATGARDGG